jgi:mono/diheme cytochrome c family protein
MGMLGGRGMMWHPHMMGGPGLMGMSAMRRQYFMPYGILREYAGKTNPVRPTAANLSAGKRLHETSCASCHGPRGLGNGPAAQGLNPPPPNIAATAQIPMATDSYLYWTIAEGGTHLKTAMPPFKSVREPTQIWEIILYLRRI